MGTTRASSDGSELPTADGSTAIVAGVAGTTQSSVSKTSCRREIGGERRDRRHGATIHGSGHASGVQSTRIYSPHFGSFLREKCL